MSPSTSQTCSTWWHLGGEHFFAAYVDDMLLPQASGFFLKV
jgi:hypothetical protein